MRLVSLLALVLLSFTPAKQSCADSEEQLLSLLNNMRKQHNLNTLSESQKLSHAANKHAADMEINNYFSHTSLDNSDFWQRILDQNYKPCFAAENIAQGQTTAVQTLNDWNKSKGHRKNNLTPKATEFGIGHVGSTWVLLLARPC